LRPREGEKIIGFFAEVASDPRSQVKSISSVFLLLDLLLFPWLFEFRTTFTEILRDCFLRIL